MSPLAHGAAEERSPPPRVFLQRLVQEVPSLQDALILYNTTKVFNVLYNQINRLLRQTRNDKQVHIAFVVCTAVVSFLFLLRIILTIEV